MDKYSYLSNTSSEFLDEEFEKFKKDPQSVDFGWRKTFTGKSQRHMAKKNFFKENAAAHTLKKFFSR